MARGSEKFVKRRRKQTGGEGSKTIYLTRNVTEIPIGFDYLGLKLKGFPVLRHIPSLMSSNSYRGGSAYGDAAPFRSREGLSTRPAASSDEIQLRIDPMDMDLDHEITGLRGQVKKLRNQTLMTNAQAGVKNNIRRLNKSIVRSGSNHVVHVVCFALICFFVVYAWSKMFRK
ncbi:hypothetical protein Ahy_A07g033435 isoform D [Arachis hypogaea]|uniref:t-SNARE coiled-coil homology domain-containing protein n=1 Tax=Arachis hypogaea TaxID=3818 RepID=A0A445C9I1_ARAHY|nr:hypothetical protein Ahy_A07g033435 isoform D [Arachis hypogaea]